VGVDVAKKAAALREKYGLDPLPEPSVTTSAVPAEKVPMTNHPPKPQLALAVGVIGHRLNRLPEAARERVASEIARVLGVLKQKVEESQPGYQEFFAPERPVLSIVSALAEGADRMVAQAGREQGFVLDAPLPFARDIYETDFDGPDSRAAYRELLGKARSVLELPGERAAIEVAYEAVGLTVLANSDILLTVWDGGPSAGRGGTTEMLTAATRLGIPIIHVDAAGAAPSQVRWSRLAEFSHPADRIEELPIKLFDAAAADLVDQIMRPPGAATERKALKKYLRERAPQRTPHIMYPMLLAATRVRPLRKDWRLPQPAKLAADHAKFASDAVAADDPRASTALTNAYGWADAVGTRFSQAFRSAFVINFLLGALAVVAVVASLVAHDAHALDRLTEDKLPFVLFELGCLVLVVVNTFVGRWLNWHGRWVEPRELAERLRVALPLWALGSRPTSFFGEEPAWTGWYARAVTREQGLRAGNFGDGLKSAGSVLLGLLRDQCGYNETTAKRMEQLETRLEWIGGILFALSFVASVAFVTLALTKQEMSVWQVYLVTAITAGLPALATAIYGIRVIGDFAGIAKRAERTHKALARLIEAIEQDQPDLAVMRGRARATADAMLGDVASWRLFAESRGLSLP
jgi:hypothetical protein